MIVLQRQLALSEQMASQSEESRHRQHHVSYEQAQGIERTLKARYDEVASVKISATVHNRLRTHLRDALVAYLLQNLRN